MGHENLTEDRTILYVNLLYVNSSSNHPPQVVTQLPTLTDKRLSKNSSSIEIFNSAKVEYGIILENSGYLSIKLN